VEREEEKETALGEVARENSAGLISIAPLSKPWGT
jgi:hypothetical protein